MVRKLLVVAALAGVGLLVLPSGTAYAAGGECSGGKCGTPDTSGGGCGCGCGGSILVNNTDEGDTYQYADDFDADGAEDDFDNCPFVANKGQADADGDGIGDSCDACPKAADPKQADIDGDGIGDQCDTDQDNDGKLNAADNCPLVSNIAQMDGDKDGQGDACDTDDDNDGVLDVKDNCPLVANPDQKNTDPNLYGDACDADQDKDNILDSKDNCPAVGNVDQKDADKDGIGDLCDPDQDNDGVVNAKDNCLATANPAQVDADRDGKGDACDNRFCYTVGRDEQNCLDPTTTFKLYSPDSKVNTGDPLRLRLFANRADTAIRYKWIVESKPAGSTATVENPQGTVRQSSPYEYFYLKGNVATFTPDKPGEYKIRLVGEMVFADTVNAAFPKANQYVMTVVAAGESQGGCSVGGNTAAGATTGLMLLGLLALVLVRRKR